jgi:hypothetical protein
VFSLNRLQGFFKAVSRIEYDVPASTGESANLTCGFGHFVSGDAMPGGFHRPDRRQNIGGHKLNNGLVAYVGAKQADQPALFLDIGSGIGVFFDLKPLIGPPP